MKHTNSDSVKHTHSANAGSMGPKNSDGSMGPKNSDAGMERTGSKTSKTVRLELPGTERTGSKNSGSKLVLPGSAEARERAATFRQRNASELSACSEASPRHRDSDYGLSDDMLTREYERGRLSTRSPAFPDQFRMRGVTGVSDVEGGLGDRHMSSDSDFGLSDAQIAEISARRWSEIAPLPQRPSNHEPAPQLASTFCAPPSKPMAAFSQPSRAWREHVASVKKATASLISLEEFLGIAPAPLISLEEFIGAPPP